MRILWVIENNEMTNFCSKSFLQKWTPAILAAVIAITLNGVIRRMVT